MLAAQACYPSYWGGRDKEGRGLKPVRAKKKSEILFQKYPTQKRASGVAQVVVYLPTNCGTLSLNPSTK
jgi:hypothetical protein